MAIISKVETTFKSIYEEDKSELNSLIKQQRVECSSQGAGVGAGAGAGVWGVRQQRSGVSIPCATISETSPACLAPSLSPLSLCLSPLVQLVIISIDCNL